MHWPEDLLAVAELEHVLQTQRKTVERISTLRNELCGQIAPHTITKQILIARGEYRSIPCVRVPKHIVSDLKQAKKWLLPHEDYTRTYSNS
jgi:hypothetical protein